MLTNENSFSFQISLQPSGKYSSDTEWICSCAHDHLDWPRLSYREQFKEGDEEADRGNDGKRTSKSGLDWRERQIERDRDRQT